MQRWHGPEGREEEGKMEGRGRAEEEGNYIEEEMVKVKRIAV